LLLFLWVTAISVNVSAQANAYINVLTQNSGQVNQGGVVNIQIEVGNTGPNSIVASKVKTAITVPTTLVSVLPSAQQTGLPAGWTILSNTAAGVITLCNGTDVIPANEQRTILIKVQGNNIGGPSTLIGQLSFSGGTNCGSPGSLSGNSTADDNSTSSIQVVNVVPVTLTDFTAVMKDCEPVLHWITESEINSDRFEIEKSTSNTTTWQSIAVIPATGHGSSQTNYSFTDTHSDRSADKVFYRLKMIDQDGKFKYSKILPVPANCKNAAMLVYPNPVNDGKLYINISGTGGYTEAKLMSATGQTVLVKKIMDGTNLLNTSNIADGIYILSVQDSNGFKKQIKVSVKH
jgi:hypothetical protein